MFLTPNVNALKPNSPSYGETFDWTRSAISGLLNPNATPQIKNKTLEAYYRQRYPTYQVAQHHRITLGILQDLKPNDALILNMPPRHGKSDMIGAWLEYSLGRQPDHENIYASYSASLSYKRSRRIRNEIRDGQAFKAFYPGLELSNEAAAVGFWQLAGQETGGFSAVGVGGSITGMGAHKAAIDDPIKGRKQAESATVRDGVVDWFKSDLLTRLTPDGILIVNQTRWHQDDLAGWILENKDDEDFGNFNWIVVSFPALALEGVTLSEYDWRTEGSGEALWPERWPAPKLKKIHRILGDYDFQALYQQDPMKKGGNLYSDTPAIYTEPNLNGSRIFITCDLAASTSNGADYTAFNVSAHYGPSDDERCMDVLDIRRGHYDLAAIHLVAHQLQSQWKQVIDFECIAKDVQILDHIAKPQRYVIEGREVSLPGIRMVRHQPQGSKYARALPSIAAWNAGRIRVPFDAAWVADYRKEHENFTGNEGKEKDDQVDGTSRQWLKGTITQRRPNVAGTGTGRAQTTVSGSFKR